MNKRRCSSCVTWAQHRTHRRMILRHISLVGFIVLPKLVSMTSYFLSYWPTYSTQRTVLGVPYDPAIDIWSVGCTLYELYTGKILLPGRSNNQMLLLMMELKGRFNSKMIKKAKFGDVYFDDMGGFESVEKDRITGKVSHCIPVQSLLLAAYIPHSRILSERSISSNPRGTCGCD